VVPERDGNEYELPSVDEVAITSDDLFAERLGAVRLLLETRDRDVATHDILLASAFEFLDSGPKTTDEVLTRIRREWPGVVLTRSTVEGSLEAAAEHSFVDCNSDLGDTEKWRLLDFGRRRVEACRRWGQDVVHRTNTYLADEARKHLGMPGTEEQVRAWGSVLRDALFEGIKDALTEGGSVKVVDDSLLFPDRYDLDAIRTRLAGNCHDTHVCSFLSVMAGAALDPGNPFGSELVHHIATGYILYAYVGRRDRASARASVGSLRGEQAILDTPVLLRMLGSHGSTAPVMDLVTQALRTGVNVIVSDHTVTELERLLDNRENNVVPDVEKALQHDSAEEIIRRSDDQVVTSWLETPGSGRNGRASWKQFRDAAARLPGTLRAIGVNFGLDDEHDLADSKYFFEFRKHLTERVTRGDWNIDHDARILVAVRQTRTVNPANADKIWPGAFIVTTDRQIGPIYNDVVGKQRFPVTVSPSQWAGVIASCSDPIGVHELAKAMASDTSHETLLARAVNIPLATALEIGRCLADTGMNAVDAESVQLAFEDIVNERPDLLGADPTRLAGEVLNRHHQSYVKVTAEQRTYYEEALRRTSKEREVLERVGRETQAVLRGDRDTEHDRRLIAEKERDTERRRRQRLARAFGSTVMALLLVGALVAAVLTDTLTGWWIVVAALTLVVYAAAAADYCTTLERPTWRFVVAAVGASGALGVEVALGAALA
jgi:hypothetical protein